MAGRPGTARPSEGVKAQTLEEILPGAGSVQHWYHRFEVAPGVFTPGFSDCNQMLERVNPPKNLRGKRVLDLGTRDGFFAFEMERRGASVVAIDYVPSHVSGFDVMRTFYKSKVRFLHQSFEHLNHEEIGTFDLVLFLGLLYHLRNPLGALDRVRGLCNGSLILETQCIDECFLSENGNPATLGSYHADLAKIPLMQFYPRDTLNKDWSNFWAPNLRCLEDMLAEADFQVTHSQVYGSRAVVHADVGRDERAEDERDIATGRRMPFDNTGLWGTVPTSSRHRASR